MVELRWLALATAVLVCATATAASGGAAADRHQHSAVALPGRDSDGDGLDDGAEVGRYKTNPRLADTDRDGLDDGAEIRRYHTDPRRRDTDRDGLKDGAEIRRYKTNPRLADTDRDGLDDGAEVGRYKTNPRLADTDRDGLDDGAEIRRYHTDPRSRDTDGDGWGDRVELREGANPLDRRNRPGFPAADNTGVPPGTVLSAYAGPSTISTPNTMIVGQVMGCIRIAAPGVVIRNSKISCPGFITVLAAEGDYSGTPLLLEDSEIDCQNTGGTAIAYANVTVRRLNIHGCENGLSIDQSVTVEDSYIHDMYNGPEAHTDGIQFGSHFENGQLIPGALNVTIRHNTIYGMGADGSFGTSAIITNHPGTDRDVLIEDNLLAGGSYALYCNSPGAGTNYRVVNNHFSRKFSPKVGYFGVSADCADETQSGNVYHETGRPLRLG